MLYSMSGMDVIGGQMLLSWQAWVVIGGQMVCTMAGMGYDWWTDVTQ